jgi:glycosyltransferase involved in cell wall biosynthesis
MDNMKCPLVSIVFTSYNHKEYLRQALDSLVNQTYPNLEVIIIDDCSTDGSQDVLKEYAHHSNINLKLQTQNSGSYVKASNYGASFAKGEYILFAQCDDFAEPDQITILVNEFKDGIGVVFSKSRLIDEHGEYITDDFLGRESDFRKKCLNGATLTGAEMRQYLSYSCVIPNLSAAMIKRELYIRSGGLSEKYLVAADWALWLELAELTTFKYLSEPLNNFRQHATTIRSKTKIKIQVDEIYTIFYGHIQKYGLKGKDRLKMKTGAGAIWFWYFIDSPKQWLLGFPDMFRSIRKFEKWSIWFLFTGFLKQVREVIISKMEKGG